MARFTLSKTLIISLLVLLLVGGSSWIIGSQLAVCLFSPECHINQNLPGGGNKSTNTTSATPTAIPTRQAPLPTPTRHKSGTTPTTTRPTSQSTTYVPPSNPKPTPTPTPKPTPTYPETIQVNYTTSCDGNNPSYIEGKIDQIEIVSATEVLYYITYINNSNSNLGLNIYTMNLTDDGTGLTVQATALPAVPINAHSSTNVNFTFDTDITLNTRYTLSWDIAEGNVFTCTFPNYSLAY